MANRRRGLVDQITRLLSRVRQVFTDFSKLALTELRQGIFRSLKGVVIFIMALSLIPIFMFFLNITLALFIHNLGLSLWTSFLVVTGTLFLFLFLLLFVAFRMFKGAFKFKKTKKAISETSDWINGV